MELNRIHNIAAVDLLASLDEAAALIIADPPYGIGYKSSMKRRMRDPHARKGKPDKPRHVVERFDDKTIDLTWLVPAFDALKDGGAMYLFTRWDVMHHWRAAALGVGFKIAQRIIWDKDMLSMGNLKTYGSQLEDILVCVKGKHKLRWDKREGNLWHYSRGDMMNNDIPKGGPWRHPTQKPVALLKKMIANSSDVGDLIVDPFTGSGAACIAAQRLHRRFIGSDVDPEFAANAQAWIEQTAPHTLPMF